MDRNSLVYKAKLSKEAERFDEMVADMKNVARQPQQLTAEERSLLSVAYKNVCRSRRASWRVVKSREQGGDYNADKMTIIRDYKIKIENELCDICNDILSIIEESLLPNSTSEEARVYYDEMKRYYQRYLSEFQQDTRVFRWFNTDSNNMSGSTRRRLQAPLQNAMNELERINDNTVFIYTGREQVVPLNVTNVIIDPSVKVIPRGAFLNRRHLISVQMHDGVERIEEGAFQYCTSLREINLRGVKFIEFMAFLSCESLQVVELDDNLDTIGRSAFQECIALKCIKVKSARIIERWTFNNCLSLTELELLNAERIEEGAFNGCPSLRRIAIPLRNNLFLMNLETNRCTLFNECHNLTKVDLVERIHKMIEALSMETWKAEMNQEIDRINQVLPDTDTNNRADAVRDLLRSVNERMNHFKAEHHMLLKEGTSLLELALWKAELDEKGDSESCRQKKRISSGAVIVIENVLPFLRLE